MALLEDPLPLEAGQRSVATYHWRLLEFSGCWWVTMVATLIGLVPLVFGRAVHIYAPQLTRMGESWTQVIRWAVVALWLLLDVPFLSRLWGTWSQRPSHEIALYVAALQPLRHPILRPLVAAWWLGHFALAIRIGVYFENNIPMDPRIALMMFMFVIFCAAYASNIFLIHAVSALTRGPAVQRVWNWRGAYDVGLVVAGLLWKLSSDRSLFK